MIREGTAEAVKTVSCCLEKAKAQIDLQWASYTSNSVHAANETHVGWTLSQRYTDRDYEHGAAEDASRTNTGNGTSDDQGSRVGRNTTDERADFEDEEGRKVDPFDGVEGVKLSVDELGGAGGE